jgi:hypothetical protein
LLALLQALQSYHQPELQVARLPALISWTLMIVTVTVNRLRLAALLEQEPQPRRVDIFEPRQLRLVFRPLG